MSGKVLESIYSQKVRRFVESRGGMFLVNTASVYDKAGRPDVEIIYKGHVIFAELKTGDYQPTNLQIMFLNNLRKQGVLALLLRDTLDELETVFHLIDTNYISNYEQPPLPEIKMVDLFEEDE
ncbi:nuclease [Enterococcus phage Phi_Eg_SY1]|nr:nuclease [Enterococcus phage Phi_Eg_SY1]